MNKSVLFALTVTFLATLFIATIAIQRSVTVATERDAIDKALHWAWYLSIRLPDLEGLIESGTLTEDQQQVIRQVRELGDVFRFKLFNAQGQLVLLSDDTFISAPKGIATEVDPEPATVAETGETIVGVHDGTQKPDRPDLYAEAYTPLFGSDGAIVGVVEVYVDETHTAAHFRESFSNVAWMVALLCAVVFVVPAIGLSIQRERAQNSRAEAAFLATYDPLTGLLNRSEFTLKADAMLAEGTLSAFLFLDADRFKQINDKYGHAAGDQFLQKVAMNLKSCLNHGDLVGRFGGDEFVIGLRNANDAAVTTTVQKILKLAAEPMTFGKKTITGSVTIGVAFPRAGDDLDHLVGDADAALYSAKSAGRNQFAVYGPDMGAELRRRNRLETIIRDAVDTQGFRIEYQPLVDAVGRNIIGYEALLRLRDDAGRPIPPDEFIPLAETMGLMDEIGTWVLQEATRNIAALPGAPKVSVNLSVMQFRGDALPKIVREALDKSGLPAERLELEITESLLLEDTTRIALLIDALREMGVKIAMDDFGTGFSSLGYLWQFGFDRIKIDRSFVLGLENSPEKSKEIIETVVLLGKRLGMQVTAEGVETVGHCDLLSKLGCDVLQGFYFGRPAALTPPDVENERLVS